MNICKDNSNQIRGVETKMARYIFNSYIKGKKYRLMKKKKLVTSKEFMAKIFLKSSGLITQSNLLKEELTNISKVDNDYLLNPDKYKNTKKTHMVIQMNFVVIISFIKKHKFTRCSNKIDEENGGDMYCQHWDSTNPYEDEYNKLVDNMEK